MSGVVIAAMAALAGSVIAAAFTYLASRKTTNDDVAIKRINLGQEALEAALARATVEIADARAQLVALRKELADVHAELSKVLKLHAECEQQRTRDALELVRLRAARGQR